jgi:aminodeoxyfutalosine synthase
MATALVESRFTDTGLGAVKDKVLAGRRLSFEDGVALFKSHDLLAIGHLANIVRERKHGDAAYFIWNTHINHTNVCVATCDFCAFAAKKGEPRAYTMGLPDVFANVAALPAAVREVHIVGGLHPDLPWSYFIDMMKGIKQVRPDIHIKAFTAVEIFFFHRLYRMTVAQVLSELKEAGLDSLPGGGAEIFAKETRDKIVQGKADAGQWLDVMREAHKQGIPTNATMLYGHIESAEDRCWAWPPRDARSRATPSTWSATLCPLATPSTRPTTTSSSSGQLCRSASSSPRACCRSRRTTRACS